MQFPYYIVTLIVGINNLYCTRILLWVSVCIMHVFTWSEQLSVCMCDYVCEKEIVDIYVDRHRVTQG